LERLTGGVAFSITIAAPGEGDLSILDACDGLGRVENPQESPAEAHAELPRDGYGLSSRVFWDAS
jgi:hypothetical protein